MNVVHPVEIKVSVAMAIRGQHMPSDVRVSVAMAPSCTQWLPCG